MTRSDFLVEIEVVPDGLPEGHDLDRLRAAESARAAELGAAGVLRRLWRPAGPGWRNVGIWTGADAAEVDRAVRSLPMAAHLRWTVQELLPHPNDPGPVQPS
ncbi:muconolactone Delta-isomerase family protein [Nocardioides zeae]|uniref:Muconolactone Delta-isomerase family protein n=1 Tax=Nocardioides imazamoxiresistens TaxID=3231893 RepID=A0ABU3PSS0_9ACTN|nr:muconolactone Delta-isomerase family protein [Nocardioides zeae]MDT9592284.1 muconolactone Delta-isomerase family protein [Nocardioides zeae]